MADMAALIEQQQQAQAAREEMAAELVEHLAEFPSFSDISNDILRAAAENVILTVEQLEASRIAAEIARAQAEAAAEEMRDKRSEDELIEAGEMQPIGTEGVEVGSVEDAES